MPKENNLIMFFKEEEEDNHKLPLASKEEDNPKLPFPFPLDSDSNKLIDLIGYGVAALVYRAECVSLNSTVVAVKTIDLDHYNADSDLVRSEIETLSLISHPNILNAHASFTVGGQSRLWVVMPFVSAGSLQSIISSSNFPDHGLPEECVSVVLKETLNALSYLHNQLGHLHGDIKAGNILIDNHSNNGNYNVPYCTVKLDVLGFAASIYESCSGYGKSKSSSSSSSNLMLVDVMETPYWIAPELILHSKTETGYFDDDFKSDIWGFGITALELAHGINRPPLSHLPPSNSSIMKIIKRFRFSGYDQFTFTSSSEEQQFSLMMGNKFSEEFKDMVSSCLEQDPANRPSAEQLLEHSFFKSCDDQSWDFLVKHVLHGLPNIDERFKRSKIVIDVDVDENVEDFDGELDKFKRISGWNFNKDRFELDPVFLSTGDQYCAVVQSSFDATMVDGLMALKNSMDDGRRKVLYLIKKFGVDVEMKREDELLELIQSLKLELNKEKENNFQLQKELEYLK